MNIGNLFKFLREKEKRRIPIEIKFIYFPELLTNANLHTRGDLFLQNSIIRSLPEGLTVGGHLNLYSTNIESLPEGLKVGGSLNLRATHITSLPEGLEVGWSLYLDNSDVQSLPKNLIIKRNIYLQNTFISKNYTKEEVKEMCPGIEGLIVF